MTILQAFISGIRAANSSVRMVLLVYILTFLLVLPLGLAFHSVLVSSFGDSTMPERMMRDFDFTTFDDFMTNHSEALTGIFRQILWVTVVYAIFSVLLAGGVLSALMNGGFSLVSFFKGCGEYAFRFLRLLLFFGVVVTVGAVLWLFVAGVITAVVSGGAETEKGTMTGFVFTASLTVILFTLFLVILDYTKILIVAENKKSVVKTFWRGVKFVFRNFRITAGLQVLLFLVLGALVVLYWVVEGQVGMASGGTIVLMVIIQQIVVGSRVWARVWAYGSEIAVYRTRQQVSVGEIGSFTIRETAGRETITATETAAVQKPIVRRTRRAKVRRATKKGKAR